MAVRSNWIQTYMDKHKVEKIRNFPQQISPDFDCWTESRFAVNLEDHLARGTLLKPSVFGFSRISNGNADKDLYHDFIRFLENLIWHLSALRIAYALGAIHN